MAKRSLAKRKADVSSKYWRTKADGVWKVLVKHRDGNKCIVCGSTGTKKSPLNAHHLIDKDRVVAYRHVLDNGVTACSKHHKFNLECSAHRAPWVFLRNVQRICPMQYTWWENHHTNLPKGQKNDYKAHYERLLAIAQEWNVEVK